MDDDIDIEEHDLMDDPRIKSIFPDISKLKEEILDPSYEESEIPKAKDSNSNSTLTNTSTLSPQYKITEFEQVKKHNSVIETTKRVIKTEPENQCLPPAIPYFSNKIILGSKKSKDNKQVKIILKNIYVNLEKSRRFCNICLILFPSKQSFEEHMTCSTHLSEKYSNNNKNILKSQIKNNALKVTVKVNNNKIQNEDTKKDLRGCFHCNLVFPSQKSLIDHLYEVLGRNMLASKNATSQKADELHISILKISKDSHEVEKTTVNITDNSSKTNEDAQIKYVYQCKLCSYYFNQEKFYKIHIIQKHKSMEIECLEKVPFDPKCIFCFRDYHDVKTYNSHLIKSHRDIVLKNRSNNKNENNGSQLKLLDRTEKEKCTERDLSDSRNNTLILSSIIFKCLKCYIHFLSSSVAINHEEHNQMLINWKCTICQRFFKRSDEQLHVKQHQYATSFTVYDLCDTDFDKVLFKCSMCAIHCREEDYSEHIIFCKKGQVSSSYCSFCDILIDNKIKETHEKNHNYKNMSESDFILIDSGKQTSIKFNINEDSGENRDSYLPLTRKPSKRKKVDSESDSDSKPLSLTLKQSKRNKTKNDLDKSSDSSAMLAMNVVFESDSDSNLKSEAVESLNKDNSCDDFDSDSEKKISMRSLKRLKKSKHQSLAPLITKELPKIFQNKSKSQLQILNLTYCKFCECFISRTYKLDVHIESRCTQILKRVCTYCGLTVTAKCSGSHKAFHKLNPNLRLQDFQFYDIKTNEAMCPPIPKFPKCDYCDKHFTSKVEIIGHICIEDDFRLCNICNIKLSDKAYNLHLNFHSYVLENNKNNLLNQDENEKCLEIRDTSKPMSSYNSENNKSNICSLEMKKESKSKDSAKSSFHVIFKCKVCDISVDEYDMLVEHCHFHYKSEDLVVNTKKCEICDLQIAALSFESHQNLHLQTNKEGAFKIILVDVFYFGTNNEEWLKLLFGSLPPEVKVDILEKSIYKFESRIKMEIKQNGPYDLTLYHCEKCRCFIDSVSLFRHIGSCNGSKVSKYPCRLCGVTFLSSLSKSEHEKTVHKQPGIALKSYRIVSFNKSEDKDLNDALANTYNRYILYKCRNCGSVVDKKQSHLCNVGSLKKCIDCGLLINEEDYDKHSNKHKLLDSFVENNMKVILFGNKTEEFRKQDIVCSFGGIVYDYTYYECVKCKICERYLRRSSKHFCLIDVAKLTCPKCKLVFDEGKMKGHLKLHNNDPDFSRENMLVIPFNPDDYNDDMEAKHLKEKLNTSNNENEVKVSSDDKNSTQPSHSEKTDTIYKCTCGLHHLTKSNMHEHGTNNCSRKKSSARQTCAKCGLVFTPNVLFKHLIKHHGDKNVHYKLEIVEI